MRGSPTAPPAAPAPGRRQGTPSRPPARAVAGVGAVALLGTAAMAVAWGRAPSERPPRATIAVAVERELTPRITATGSVRLMPRASVKVGAQVSGVVDRLLVTQGSRLRAGDLIAELDPREFRARLADAEARVVQLTADSAQADADAVRVETLRRSEGATDQEALAARTKRADAIAQLGAARAQREIARLDLERTRIRTPVAGIVASVSTQEGETVASTFTAPTFVTIVDPTQLECVALVDETDIGRVRPGASAEFTVDAYPGRTFTGVVTRIAPDATIVSGVVDYEVTIRITEGTALLKPQMTATVGIISGAKRALVIPSTAVRQGVEGPYLWRVRGGRPTPVPITVGTRQPDLTEVDSGISAGDSVLTGGFPDAPAPGGSASS